MYPISHHCPLGTRASLLLLNQAGQNPLRLNNRQRQLNRFLVFRTRANVNAVSRGALSTDSCVRLPVIVFRRSSALTNKVGGVDFQSFRPFRIHLLQGRLGMSHKVIVLNRSEANGNARRVTETAIIRSRVIQGEENVAYFIVCVRTLMTFEGYTPAVVLLHDNKSFSGIVFAPRQRMLTAPTGTCTLRSTAAS